MENINYFLQHNFFTSLQQLFSQLEVPVHYLSQQPTRLQDVLQDRFDPGKESHQMAGDVYVLGIVDKSTFKGEATRANPETIRQSGTAYNGIVILGIELERPGKLPARGHMLEIVRDLNRHFHATPVVVVFRYAHFLSFAAIERMAYQQEWREGEKTGKVFILRDVDLRQTHAGHLRILRELSIPRQGRHAVKSIEGLHAYWQSVLNVSILNKQFYRELQNWFFWAVDQVEFPDDAESDREKRNATSIIRLITRLVFVWFLKEKKLIDERVFDREYIDELLNWSDSTHSTYYKAILQNLFFATLNTEMDKDTKRKRKWVNRQPGVQGFYRYKRFFKKDQAGGALALFQNTPFLNGGLFENLDRNVGQENEQRIDCFSDRPKNEKRLVVPDELFWGAEREVDLSRHLEDEKKKKKKKARPESVRGLIHILNDYKFTIAENTPIDEEVALDPEMLGRVFENLLAAYNPETKSTARKETGSFYTPRDIVDYMVDESLIAYLKRELPGDLFDGENLEPQLRSLLAFGPLNPFEKASQQQALIKALNACKIIDPACGSGAFPMGILQKIVHVLGKLDPENELWKAEQIRKARAEFEHDLQVAQQIQNRKLRQSLEEQLQTELDNIESAFDEQDNELDYARKLYLIGNCIYGVDIQPIATQICKLRFFISLLVDQKTNEDRPNRGILPLPNLETRFVAADSLLSLQRGGQLTFRTQQLEELEKELKEIRREYFRARTTETKRKYRRKDKELRKEIAQALINGGWQAETARRVSEWNPYDQNGQADFLDPEWMFGVLPPEGGGGFDIVIGNPPYVQIQKFSGRAIQAKWKAEGYETFARTGDIYSLFYERGWRLLRPGGVLAYITSNKWMRANYGESTRKFLAEKTNPQILFDFGMAQNFESATTYTNILLFERAKNKKATRACRIRDDFQPGAHDLSTYFKQQHSVVDNFGKDSWVAYSEDEYRIKRFVEKAGKGLIEWDINIFRGILTGYNKAFFIDQETRDELVKADPNNAEVLKRLVVGDDISRWYPDYQDKWLIGTFPFLKLNIDSYPQLKRYLEVQGPKSRLEPRPKDFKGKWGGRKSGSYRWFETQDSIKYWEEFEKPKIIYMEITKDLPFAYDEDAHYYSNNKTFIITGPVLKYLSSVLNSTLWRYCFRDNFPEVKGDSREVRKVFFEQIPVKVPTAQEAAPLERMTEYLTLLTRHRNTAAVDPVQVAFFERLNDALVYELYFGEAFAERGIAIRTHLGQLPALPDLKDPARVVTVARVYGELTAAGHALPAAMARVGEVEMVGVVMGNT